MNYYNNKQNSVSSKAKSRDISNVVDESGQRLLEKIMSNGNSEPKDVLSQLDKDLIQLSDAKEFRFKKYGTTNLKEINILEQIIDFDKVDIKGYDDYHKLLDKIRMSIALTDALHLGHFANDSQYSAIKQSLDRFNMNAKFRFKETMTDDEFAQIIIDNNYKKTRIYAAKERAKFMKDNIELILQLNGEKFAMLQNDLINDASITSSYSDLNLNLYEFISESHSIRNASINDNNLNDMVFVIKKDGSIKEMSFVKYTEEKRQYTALAKVGDNGIIESEREMLLIAYERRKQNVEAFLEAGRKERQ